MKESIMRLRALEKQLFAYRYALNAIDFDAETVAPEGSAEGRAEACEVLSRASFDLLVNDDTAALLQQAAADAEDEQQAAEWVVSATDIPGDTSRSGNLHLGDGVGVPLNADSSPVLLHILREVAARQGIPLQCFPGRNLTGGTDALQLKSGGNVAVLNLSIPLRYMHSRYEVCDVRDVLHAVDLVCALVSHFNDCPTQNFVPWLNNF